MKTQGRISFASRLKNVLQNSSREFQNVTNSFGLGRHDGGAYYVDYAIAYTETFLSLAVMVCLDGLLACDETSNVNVEHIRRRLSKGFKPFALVTSSGDKFVVPHPEFIMLHPRTVVVMDKDGYAAVLDPLRVVGLQDVRGVENGRQKSRRR
jgi:hypothetical protein